MKVLTPEGLERAKELALKATPGVHQARWVPDGMPADPCRFGVISDATGREVLRCWDQQDAEFSTHCHPGFVLALVEEVERLRGEQHKTVSEAEVERGARQLMIESGCGLTKDGERVWCDACDCHQTTRAVLTAARGDTP